MQNGLSPKQKIAHHKISERNEGLLGETRMVITLLHESRPPFPISCLTDSAT
jgi:hypothetical protein